MDKDIRTMEFVGLDGLYYPTYRCLETGHLWKDLSLDDRHPQLHYCGDLDDDPGPAIKSTLTLKFKSKYRYD